ncbi:hypothetical protein [Mesomycoplasma ovipneumoniae]|uniref:hypothetical protein n=1 Tax=Mesomycoplasma ovipneumoniae TaxID=29562 RepID=UPI003080F5FF
MSKFFKMNMLEKINKSGAIKIIEKKLIVWDFSTYLPQNGILFKIISSNWEARVF